MNESECTDEVLKHVFRSATDEEIPLFKERVQCLREAGEVLCNVSLCYQHRALPKLMENLGIRRQLCKLH